MNEPWSCPSPGCPYRGVESIHILEVMGRCPSGHMSSAQMSHITYERREAERAARTKDTVVCQAELPVELFVGLTVSAMFEKVSHLRHLLSYSERLVVQDDDNNLIARSPASLQPTCATALFTIRWLKAAVPELTSPEGFWAFVAKGYRALTLAEEIRLDFPGGQVTILKDRYGSSTPNDQVSWPG